MYFKIQLSGIFSYDDFYIRDNVVERKPISENVNKKYTHDMNMNQYYQVGAKVMPFLTFDFVSKNVIIFAPTEYFVPSFNMPKPAYSVHITSRVNIFPYNIVQYSTKNVFKIILYGAFLCPTIFLHGITEILLFVANKFDLI